MNEARSEGLHKREEEEKKKKRRRRREEEENNRRRRRKSPARRFRVGRVEGADCGGPGGALPCWWYGGITVRSVSKSICPD